MKQKISIDTNLWIQLTDISKIEVHNNLYPISASKIVREAISSFIEDTPRPDRDTILTQSRHGRTDQVTIYIEEWYFELFKNYCRQNKLRLVDVTYYVVTTYLCKLMNAARINKCPLAEMIYSVLD